MNAYTKLCACRDAIWRLNHRWDERLKWFTEATRTTPVMSDGGGGSSEEDKQADKYIRYIEANTAFREEWLADEYLIVEGLQICKAVGGLEMQVLMLRYIEGMRTYKDIADELGYTEEWVKELHKRGLDRADEQIKRNGIKEAHRKKPDTSQKAENRGPKRHGHHKSQKQ